MKRSILRALALCLTTAFVSGISRAQDDQSKSAGNQGAQPGANPYGFGAQTSSPSAQPGQAVRISRLMNNALRSQSADNLGQVQDIVVDPASGQIQFVVLQLSASAVGAPGASAATGVGGQSPVSNPRTAPSTTGSFGAPSGRLVAVPWRLLSHGSGDRFTATVDRAKLESAPSFSAATWPTMDSAWMQRVYSHFGVSGTSTGAPGSGSGTGTGTGTGTGLGNPSTPGVPSTPGTPDINPPGTGANPGTTPAPGTPAAGPGAGVAK